MTPYHQDQIEAILFEMDCELWEAEKAYEQFNHNAAKAITHLLKTPVFLSTQGNVDKLPKAGMGYFIKSLDTDLEAVPRRAAFIPMEDFDSYLLEDFQAVFPLYQPQWNEVTTYFDSTSSNIFTPEVCKKIIIQLRQRTFPDESVKTFIEKVIAHIENKLPTCTYIEVYGNI
ncbi:MAG: hypothetical protein Q3983_01035 [Capnocytophaga sp.]|nr:hypothetical protein [Capnocytophaga sp.]